MDIQDIRRMRLRAVIAAQYKNVADAERQTGINASVVSQVLSEKNPKTFGEKLAQGFEEKLGLSPGDLSRPDVVDATFATRRPGRWVPVVGEARLGDGGYFNETSCEPGSEGYVLSLMAQEDSYALKCKGDSMYPAILPNDFVIVSPRQRIEFGKWVMCQTTDGRRMIKIYSSRFDGITELRSLNGKFDPITLDADEIRHLHFADGPIPPSYHQPSLD